jgi:hypothetical protein
MAAQIWLGVMGGYAMLIYVAICASFFGLVSKDRRGSPLVYGGISVFANLAGTFLGSLVLGSILGSGGAWAGGLVSQALYFGGLMWTGSKQPPRF